jgi:ATP-binding cassette subfamily B (MDR/TAP) protein 1
MTTDLVEVDLEKAQPKDAVEMTAVKPMDNATDKKKKEPSAPTQNAAFFDLFYFADKLDAFLIILGIICSIAQGVTLPLLSVVFGQLIDTFGKYEYGAISQSKFEDEIRLNVLYFVGIGVGSFTVSYLLVSTFQASSERQCKRARESYFAAILRQDISWFDVNSAGQLTTRVTSDVQVLQDGIGEKFGLYLMHTAMFFSGFVLAFEKGWRLALVLLAVIPVLGIAGAVLAKLLASSTQKGQLVYGKAGAVVEEVFSAIRTVAAYSAELFELQRFSQKLEEGKKEGVKKAMINASGLAVVMLVMFSSYGLAFWYGSILISKNEMTGGGVLNVFFAIVIGAMSLGNAGPNFACVFTN